MDAIELLTQQHEQVEDLFDQYQDVADPADRQQIVTAAMTMLRMHTTIEEEIFYPAVRELGGELEETVLEDLEEHHAVEMLLDELEGMQPSQERYAAKFRLVAELVRHHVDEEEQEQFPQVREQLEEQRLEQLGDRMAQRIEELEAEVVAESTSKEELYAQARERGVEGRSQMSKRQLANALRAAG